MGAGIHNPVRNLLSFLALLATLFFLVAGCGGGEEEPPPPPPNAGKDKAAGGAPAENKVGGATVESDSSAETLEDSPFVLNQEQPVPPDFEAAYQRKARIVVEFVKEGEDEFYPQGLEPDNLVSLNLTELSGDYREVEFFSYDIDRPGEAESSEELGPGEYGTLAAQLEVGYTPFVVMLAPRGNEYIVENLYQGYVESGVLRQALFDLTSVDGRGSSSNVDVALDRIELTESGGGVEYFTVSNEGDEDANLEGFSLLSTDPETAEVNRGAEGVSINENIEIAPGESVSIGREPDVVDADGNEVVGTFEGGDSLDLRPGDEAAFIDGDGAVVDTISI